MLLKEVVPLAARRELVMKYPAFGVCRASKGSVMGNREGNGESVFFAAKQGYETLVVSCAPNQL
jgi:hypothetical protein